ncbi:serine hydrolase domain-containing protein [Steroidobacter sp.]|uniref:serine hydrolase domain-containing protein n=1 Tax=Steroidobacter sp. TaxID=1978227 RepID=UPI001A58AA24|nr:serine hydrolase domain-containing protein [Steroidobacter sp.]MBL8267910.1 beta-lactamase family protein [Steroidobacter sp.]
MRVSVALCACLLVAQSDVHAADRFDSVRAYIREQMVEGHVPSVAVALSQRGKIVWEEGFGWADRENRVPATEHTLYSLASITKPFTATALMTLVQSGQIDLDKPVNDYLGSAKLVARVGDARDATVRRVANHSSGLPLHYHLIYSDESYRVPSRDETILRFGNLITAPGEKLEYSNLGYGVLDHVISRVSGKSYAAFLSEQVFIPLGLTRTSVGVPPGLERDQAVRYSDAGVPIPFYDSDHAGASAVYGSAHDLLRFAMFHMKDRLADQKRILSDASLDEMQRRTFPAEGNEGHGVSWKIVNRTDGYRVVEHGGGMPGVGVVLLLIPAEDVAVVVLTNQRQGRHRAIADKVLQTVLPKWRTDKKPDWQPPGAFTTPTQLAGKWSGAVRTYKADVPLTVEFFPSGDVHAQLNGQRTSLVSEALFENGIFSGNFASELDTEEAALRAPDILYLNLKLRGSLLNGGLAVMSEDERSGALTHWVELSKQ